MELTRLSPRARTLFYARSLLGLVLFWLPGALVIGTALSAFLPLWMAALAGLGLGFLAFIEALWVPWLSYERWGYALRERDLLVDRGVLVHRRTAIPIGRIQHVDTRQGPLEQGMALCRLQVFTASGMGADAVIPGLELDEAERVRDQLLTRVEESDVDDGV